MNKRYSREQREEEATGIARHPGVLRLYNNKGEFVTPEEASDLLLDGHTVECPGSGAGSYDELSALLGLGDLIPYDTGSSAGDWTFKFVNEEHLYLCQENRYPYHGFRYRVFVDV